MSVPSMVRHARIVPSTDPEYSAVPSLERARDTTAFVCPSKQWSGDPFLDRHDRTELSLEHE